MSKSIEEIYQKILEEKKLIDDKKASELKSIEERNKKIKKMTQYQFNNYYLNYGTGGFISRGLPFYRDEFINPPNGTSSFELSFEPTQYLFITRGGSQLVESDYQLIGKTIIINDPISYSIGGMGGESLIVTYSYKK